MNIAPLWRRLAAMLYDSVLIFAIWMVVGFLVLRSFGVEQARTVDGNVVVLNPLYQYTTFAAMLGSAFLFFGWFWTRSGQTLGMQAWKLKVQNADGSAISWRQASLRYVVGPFALAPVALGYFWMLIDGERRTWTDIVSNSTVVKISNFPGSP